MNLNRLASLAGMVRAEAEQARLEFHKRAGQTKQKALEAYGRQLDRGMTAPITPPELETEIREAQAKEKACEALVCAAIDLADAIERLTGTEPTEAPKRRYVKGSGAAARDVRAWALEHFAADEWRQMPLNEMTEKFGMSKSALRKVIDQLIDDETLTHNGRTARASAYRLTNPPNYAIAHAALAA